MTKLFNRICRLFGVTVVLWFVYAPCIWAKPLGIPKLTNIPDTSGNENWRELIAVTGVSFTARDSHASCVFDGKLWVVGGKVDPYTMYKLQTSYKAADVWWSTDAANWYQIVALEGDFWAQNDDALQPGPVAPWYERFGHSLDPVDLDGDNVTDVMVLMGGYNPEPSNDLWVSADGITWVFCGYADWSPRAWHATATFENKLYVVGGSPLNNEVWRLEKISLVPYRRPPLTRSMYVNYTYSFEWTLLTAAAPFSPRVGHQMISHWWFNDTAGQTIDDAQQYLVLIGGFGGVLNTSSELYDGYHGRNDVWTTQDGYNWTCINPNASFQGRGWFGLVDVHGADVRQSSLKQAADKSGEMYLVGGGNIGFSADSTQTITSIDGKVDAWWSRDMFHWNQINFQEGGGYPWNIQQQYYSKNVPQYSSQEWAKTTVDTVTTYLGLWGMTLEAYNVDTGLEYPNTSLILIAGDYSGSGARSSKVFKSLPGFYCNSKGVMCNYAGTCQAEGCVCSPGYTGDHCEDTVPVSAAPLVFLSSLLLLLPISSMVILML